MYSPELSLSLQESLQALPSVIQIKDREWYGRENMDDVKVTLSVTVDEIAELTTLHGYPVVGLLNSPGTYELEYGGWHQDPERPKLLLPQHMRSDNHHIRLRDLGNGNIETSMWDAHVIRREFIGSPSVTPGDVAVLYQRELEDAKPEEPFINLRDDIPFGDFIENYPPIRGVHDDRYDEDFWDETQGVILRPDLYMEIDRFVKRKGWIRESDALSPGASFHKRTGFLRVYIVDEWDVGGLWFNFGGRLEENPEILETNPRPDKDFDVAGWDLDLF